MITQDAALLEVCAEFLASEAQFRAIHDGPDALRDEDEAEAAGRVIVAAWGGMLSRMEQLRATTVDGIAARARCLAQHSGEGAFSFDARETVTGRLLACLLRDAGVFQASCLPCGPNTSGSRPLTTPTMRV
jgi:hypothetical protein